MANLSVFQYFRPSLRFLTPNFWKNYQSDHKFSSNKHLGHRNSMYKSRNCQTVFQEMASIETTVFSAFFWYQAFLRSDFLPWRWRHGKSLIRLFLYYKFHVYSKCVIRFWLALWDCAKKTLFCRMLKIELSTPFDNFKQSSQ